MKESQTELQAHSETKVNLLEKYLAAYLGVISHDTYTECIFINDLFCGVGLFPENKPGSPLVIGQLIDRLHTQHPSAPRVVFRYNDKEDSKVQNVTKHLAPFTSKYDTKFMAVPSCATFEETLPIILDEQSSTKNTKHFHFIDPYGYGSIKISDITSLLRGKKSEVLLFQPTTFLHRFSEKATPPALKNLMEELDDGTPWPRDLDIWGYIDHFKSLLQKKVTDDFFVDCFTIQKSANLVFSLFFFTPHIRGYEKMLNAKWALNGETGRGWHYNSTTSEADLFSTPTAETFSLENDLRDLLSSTNGATNADLYEFTLRKGFLPTHTVQILKDWQNQERLLITPTPPRKGAFYINYDHYKNKDRIFNFTLL